MGRDISNYAYKRNNKKIVWPFVWIRFVWLFFLNCGQRASIMTSLPRHLTLCDWIWNDDKVYSWRKTIKEMAVKSVLIAHLLHFDFDLMMNRLDFVFTWHFSHSTSWHNGTQKKLWVICVDYVPVYPSVVIAAVSKDSCIRHL